MGSQKIMFPIILFVICAAQMASDIYAPSLPAISIDLNTSVTHVQFSMAIYMFGLAISQLFYGALSEGLGRRLPLIAGLTILFIGNLVSLYAFSVTAVAMPALPPPMIIRSKFFSMIFTLISVNLKLVNETQLSVTCSLTKNKPYSDLNLDPQLLKLSIEINNMLVLHKLINAYFFSTNNFFKY